MIELIINNINSKKKQQSKAFNAQLIGDEINNMSNKSLVESLHISNELEYNLVSSICLGDKQSFERFLKALVNELALSGNENKILGLCTFFMNNFPDDNKIGTLNMKKNDCMKLIQTVCSQHKKMIRTTQQIETFMSAQ